MLNQNQNSNADTIQIWGKSIPVGGGKAIDRRFAVDLMALLNDLEIPYSCNVERFLLGFYFDKTFVSSKYVEAVEIYNKNVYNVNAIRVLMKSWVSLDYRAEFLGHVFAESRFHDFKTFLENYKLELAITKADLRAVRDLACLTPDHAEQLRKLETALTAYIAELECELSGMKYDNVIPLRKKVAKK